MAAFLSQASSGNAATVSATSTVTAAPSLYCSQTAAGSSGGPDPDGSEFVFCVSDGEGGTARGYWDGSEPAVDLPGYSAATSETGGDATVRVSENSAALVIASSNAVASAIANASSKTEVYAEDGSNVTATSGGQSRIGVQARSSNVDVVATQFSAAFVDTTGGSVVTAYVTENSQGGFNVDDGSDLTAYVIDRSGVQAVLGNAAQAVLAAGGGSTIGALVGASTLSALATNDSKISAQVTDGSEAVVNADDGSVVGTRIQGNSVGLVRAADGALVSAGATGGSDVYIDAYGGVEAIGESNNGADVEVTAADGSVVHAGATGAGASVKTAAVADALLEATADNSVVEALSVGGYSWSQAFDNSAIFTRSFGYGAEAYSEAFEGALVLTQADSGADPGASARVLGSATGNVYVNAEANGDGARTGVVAVPVIPGSPVGQQALVRGLAYDGAEVSVGAQFVAGDVIVAAASGEGSRAFVVVDHSTGTGPVTITVLATEGGTAYIFEDTNEFGCFGGVTSVKTSTGGCESNGNVTVITYADGSTGTFTDLVVPANLAAPVDISSPFPTIERLVPDLDVFPRSAAPGARAASTVVSPASDSVHEALVAEPEIGEELIPDHSAASDADVPVAVVTSESDEPATIYDGAAVPTAPVVTEAEGDESPDEGIDSEVADEVTTEASTGTGSSSEADDEAGYENDSGPE
ncbi:hypothetical protein AB0362_06800 [Rhodococcus sp. NPDC079359]|uniref:hypothetical protein n=1 Tax=Rhodococcus sp. NPDC079359 TaxID=3154961 RepID=UPI00344CC2CC